MRIGSKSLLGSALLVWSLNNPVWSQEYLGKVIQIKPTTKGGAAELLQQHPNKNWYASFVDQPFQLQDRFQTNQTTAAALELLLGGRVGISPNSEIEIISERNVRDAKASKRIYLRRGGMWVKASRLKEPLEIQTNGGVMGIKGTEFVVETSSSSETSVSVLEGAVEIVGTDGKVLGQAKPGDKYLLSLNAVPVVKSYGSSSEGVGTLRTELEQSDVWSGFNEVLKLRDTLTSWCSSAQIQSLREIGSRNRMAVNVSRADVISNPTKAFTDIGRAAGDAGKQAGDIGIALGQIFGGKRPAANPSQAVNADFPNHLTPDAQAGTGSASRLPVFHWTGFSQADGYVVLLSQKEDFSQLRWSGRSSDSEIAYPANTEPLEPGKYYWRVFAVDANDQPISGLKGSQTFFNVRALTAR